MTGFIQTCIELARLEKEKLELRRKEEARKFADEVSSLFSSRFQISPSEFEVIPETSGMATIEIEGIQVKAVRWHGSIKFKLVKTCKICGQKFLDNYSFIYDRRELGSELLRSDEWICDECSKQRYMEREEYEDEQVLREFVERFILPFIPE